MDSNEEGAVVVLLRTISQHPVLALFSILVSYLGLIRLREYWLLRQFRGPFSTGLSWWRHSRAVVNGTAHLYYGEVTDKYGPIARIAPNHLVTSSPELWARINAVRSPYKRTEWYYHACRFEPGKDNVFTDCDNDSHDARRKKMASGYSGKENPGLEASIDAHIKELIDLIRSKYAAPAAATGVSMPMDLATKIRYLTLDVISHIGLGKAFGHLEQDTDVNAYLLASEIGLKISNVFYGLGISWLREMPFIGNALSPSEKDESGFGRMLAEARKSIQARLSKSTDEKSDMLASFIRHGLEGDDLFSEVFEQMLAGSDTTAAAIRIILLYVITHPRVYKKLQEEIDAAVKDGIAPRSSAIISDFEARRLPYLSAVVREGLRIHPPVANLFSRVVPSTGDVVTIEGVEYSLPGGAMIGYSAWGMHRTNTSVYGPDAEVFRPERWFVDESDPDEKERLSWMQKTNDMMFGHGRWSCVGKVVAQIEIHKAVFEISKHFDLALTNPHQPWKIYNCMGLHAISDMWVDVTVRPEGSGKE